MYILLLTWLPCWQVLVAKPNKAAIGKQFKKEGKPLQESLDALTQEDAACIKMRYAVVHVKSEMLCTSFVLSSEFAKLLAAPLQDSLKGTVVARVSAEQIFLRGSLR